MAICPVVRPLGKRAQKLIWWCDWGGGDVFLSPQLLPSICLCSCCCCGRLFAAFSSIGFGRWLSNRNRNSSYSPNTHYNRKHLE